MSEQLDKAYTHHPDHYFINWWLGGGHRREMTVGRARWWLTRIGWNIIRRPHTVSGKVLRQKDTYA